MKEENCAKDETLYPGATLIYI